MLQTFGSLGWGRLSTSRSYHNMWPRYSQSLEEDNWKILLNPAIQALLKRHEKDGFVRVPLLWSGFTEQRVKNILPKGLKVWNYLSWCRERVKPLWRYVHQHLSCPSASATGKVAGSGFTIMKPQWSCYLAVGLHRSCFPHCLSVSKRKTWLHVLIFRVG